MNAEAWHIRKIKDTDAQVEICDENGLLVAVAIAEDAPTIVKAPIMVSTLEDVLEWIKTGKVDGVGFDETQVIEEIERVLKEAK